LGLARSSDMSVCLSQQLSSKDGFLWSEGRVQRGLDGEDRAGSFAVPVLL
jgi:hypothetical protein